MDFPNHRPPASSPWMITVGVSLLLHLLLFTLLSHYSGHKDPHNKPSPPLIAATLVFLSPVENEVVENKETTPLIKDAETSPILTELLKKEVDKPVEESETAREPVLEPTVAPEPINTITMEDDSAVAKEAANLNYSVLGSGKAYMDAIEAFKDQQMAAEAGRAYQNTKTSPVLSAPQRDPFVTEDEKFVKALQIKTDCSNTVNLTLRVITGITGGLVQCTELPEIEGFIQQRLKHRTLPASLPTK